MKNRFLLMTISILVIAVSSSAQESGTFTDSRDGKTYKTVKIGTQTWMAENLAYKVNSRCRAYDNNNDNASTYGYLYNWLTAQRVSPIGWHLPSVADWSKLIDALGGAKTAGGKMKESGTVHWNKPNTGASNRVDFVVLPGGCCDIHGYIDITRGYRQTGGGFHFLGDGAYFWSSDAGSLNEYAWGFSLGNRVSEIFKIMVPVFWSLSVRCIKD
jgi:uncharacterized protein (TIGR02145 family)